MKPLIKIALGGALAALSAGAFAQTVVLPSASTGGSLTLTLFSNNDATPFSYAFNLGLTMSQLSTLPTAAGSSQSFSLTGLSSDLSAYTTAGGATSSLVFDVTGAQAGIGSPITHAGIIQVAITTDPSVSLSTLQGLANQAVEGAESINTTWLTNFGTTNPSYTTSTAAANYANANYNSSLNTFAFNSASSTSNALPFYQLLTAKGAASTTIQAPIAYAGLWSINLSTDMLTYSVPGAAVPLPAGVWLLLSGLAGLGVLSRRRKGDTADMGALPA